MTAMTWAVSPRACAQIHSHQLSGLFIFTLQLHQSLLRVEAWILSQNLREEDQLESLRGTFTQEASQFTRFSSTLGMMRRASANACTPSWARPFTLGLCLTSASAKAISNAPPPGTTEPERKPAECSTLAQSHARAHLIKNDIFF